MEKDKLTQRLYNAMGKMIIYYTKCEASCGTITDTITKSSRGYGIQYNRKFNNEQKILEYRKYLSKLNEPQRTEYDTYLQDLDNYRNLRNNFAHAYWSLSGNTLVGFVTDKTNKSQVSTAIQFNSELDHLEIIADQLEEMSINLNTLSVYITIPDS